jgi:hypothetical protein
VLTTSPQLSRGHAEIKKDQGFKSWARTKVLPPNLSLWDHCKVKDGKYGYGNLPNDGFIGMSSDVQVTLNWVTNYIEKTEGTTTIYRIAQDRNLLACTDILKHRTYLCSLCLITAMDIILTCGFPDNSLDAESEYVAIGEIPWEQVIGWFDAFTVRGGGQITEAEWTDNPDFNEAKFQGKPYGTDESAGADPKVFLPLAGFPKKDKRWKEKPWSTVTAANCGSKKRSIFDDFEDKEMQLVTRDNEDIELVTGHSEDMQLVPRARSRSKTTKRPATKRLTRKTPKKKTTGKKTPIKKTPTNKKTCSAAEKKANGGVCPKKTTCTAAQKKANGGVCPEKTTCTAAQKKANGGVCLTCTAAEKKKNGGQCPPKSCPLPKTNQQLAQEYYKMYKAGTLGKGKSTTKTGGKKKGSV